MSPGGTTVRAETAAVVASGFEVAQARTLLGRPVKEFRCAEPVEPMVDMSDFKSRYDPKDPTQSRVDPAREQAEAARGGRLSAFATELARMSDLFVLSRPANREIAACVLHHLAVWARADALLGSPARNDELGRHQAIMTQAWQLATYAAVLDKIGDDAKGVPNADLVRIHAWIEALARSVIAEYTADNQWSRHGANHLYWSGLAVGYAGAVLRNPAMRDFAMTALNRGLDAVEADGALKGEMGRGARSGLYQSFATLALVALVRLADANGIGLTPEREQALTRMLTFDAALTRDSAAIEARTKVRQVAGHDRTSLAWIDVILPRVRQREPALADSLEGLVAEYKVRPTWNPYLGGNATLVYNPSGWRRDR
ncbi:alginate lyase family protein [Methylobacterium trifolii]|nr:alginate lyase family protein [Methylobacterium trifolii]